MNQIIFDTLFLFAGAAIVMLFFKFRLKKISANLNGKIDALISNASSDTTKSFAMSSNTSGSLEDFIAIENKIQNIKIPKSVAPAPKSDDSDLKEKSESLQKRFDNLQVVNELGQRVTSSLTLDETFQHLFKTINSMMDAAVVELGVYFWKENRWQVLSNLKANNTADAAHSGYKNHMAEWCLQNKREIFLDDAEKEFARYVFQPLIMPDGKAAQSVMAFPIYGKEKERGTLTVISFRKNAFNPYHVEMIRSLLPYTAVALENSLIHEEIIVMQEQLIHNEKMASIGQLTSGIAHEILNPLNFVNNFSELSKELLLEIAQTHSPEEQSELKEQLTSNLDKIHFHGNRAYGIVKSMMLLSRNGNGEKVKLNINRSIDEYLNIAYQGFKLKHADFECRIEKILDPKIGSKEMIAEDFGRVLLNLFTNALYAANEKQKKLLATDEKAASLYEPELIVKASIVNSMIVITVRDNGMGVPDEIKDKIFLPFFTTKPTGEGTGLGLSLSYDIITKGNNGNLTVKSEIGKWSEFKIEMPV